MTTQIKIHNVGTGQILEREMTEGELAQIEASQIAEQAVKAAEAVKATAKAELLAKLGITEEEARLLLS